MKKIVVTGSNGQLAKDIVERLREFSLSYRVYDFDRKALDVTDKDALEKVFKDNEPDVWIQGASYHFVEEINSNQVLVLMSTLLRYTTLQISVMSTTQH